MRKHTNRKVLSIFIILFFVFSLFGHFAAETEAASYDGIVTAHSLNVRDKPSLNGKVVGYLHQNDKVKILKVVGNWGEIDFKSKKAYISLSYVKKAAGQTFVKVSPIVSVLNVRKGPGTNYPIIGKLTMGDIVVIEGKVGNWGYFTKSGQKGYVSLSYLKEVQETVPTQKSAEKPAEKTAKVTATALNIRSAPNTYSIILGQFKKGEIVKYTVVTNKWAEITYKGRKAYVHTNYLVEVKENEMKQAKSAVVKATSLNVRSGPGTSYKSIGYLKKGDKISVIDINGKWAKITYQEKTAYVHTDYITFQNNPPASPQNPPAKEKQESKMTGYVIATNLNIRKLPSLNGIKIGMLPYGTKVEILSVENNWGKIRFQNEYAYVSMEYISLNEPETEKTEELKGKTIVIDPGHGGRDSGAVGNSLYEKNITFDIANRLKTKLEKSGAKVIMTRTSDVYVSLSERTTISNNSNAQAFVSIHINASSSPAATGFETYYFAHENATLRNQSYQLASKIHAQIIRATKKNDRGIKTANFHVIRYNKKPSILLELGFITNSSDAAYINSSSGKEKIADAIVQGLSDYFQ